MYNHYRDHILDFENDKDKFEINMRRMRNFAELEREVKDSTTLMEIGMIRICKPQMESDYSSVIERLNRLENNTTVQNNVPKEDEKLEYIRVTGYNINARCNTFLI
jgi:DNA polymerase-3 subunit gamma/tau